MKEYRLLIGSSHFKTRMLGSLNGGSGTNRYLIVPIIITAIQVLVKPKVVHNYNLR